MFLSRLALVVVALGTLLSGCGLVTRGGPSHVAQGLRYQSGQAEFDAYFKKLHELQLKMSDAPERLSQIRERLAVRLRLRHESNAELLGQRVRDSVEEMKTKGLSVKLELIGVNPGDEGKPGAKLESSGRQPTRTEARLLEAIERGAADSAILFADMTAVEGVADELLAGREQLMTQVDEKFDEATDAGRRAEVRRNLADAQTMLVEMIKRADQLATETDELMVELERATGKVTARKAAAEEPSEEEAPTKPKSTAKPRPKPRPKVQRPAPPPPRPPAQDFEP